MPLFVMCTSFGTKYSFGDQSVICTHASDTILLTSREASTLVWESEDEYVAYAHMDTVFVRFLGETVLHATTPDGRKGDIHVSVKPQHHAFREPLLETDLTPSALLLQLGEPTGMPADSIYQYVYDTDMETGTGESIHFYVFSEDRLVKVQIQSKNIDESLLQLSERFGYFGVMPAGATLLTYKFANALMYDEATIILTAFAFLDTNVIKVAYGFN